MRTTTWPGPARGSSTSTSTGSEFHSSNRSANMPGLLVASGDAAIAPTRLILLAGRLK